MSRKTVYNVIAIVKERWECKWAGTGDHNGHGCANPSAAQDLQRIYRGKGEVTVPQEYNSKLTLPEPDPPEEKYGKLKIIKKDKDSPRYPRYSMQGAEFTVKGPDGYKKTNVTTNKEGTVTLDKLPLGKYTVIETKAPANYTIDPEDVKQEIEVTEEGQTVEVTFNNPLITK